MISNNFYSSNSYLVLPTKANPKVALAVDTNELSKNSFSLYNPFSWKAKVFKKIAYISTLLNSNYFIKREKTASSFILFLEEKLNIKLISSLYFATEKDKVVLQLQAIKSGKLEIIAYVKYPLTVEGVKRIENEKKAIDILEKYKIVDKYILYDTFKNHPFLISLPLKGEISLLSSDKKINKLIDVLKRDKEYKLSNHPRIIALQKNLEKYRFIEYLDLLEQIIYVSNENYALVYEHGDFTPWNIICLKNDACQLFDFEYFIEDGLEYFDFIKYFYQIGKILKKMNSNQITNFIYKKIETPEIVLLFQLFLLKEIIKHKEENKNYDYEIEILEGIRKK